MTGDADEVHPSWFGTGGNDDTKAMQRAIDSCAKNCTLMITKAYSLTQVCPRPTRLIESMSLQDCTTAGSLLGSNLHFVCEGTPAGPAPPLPAGKGAHIDTMRAMLCGRASATVLRHWGGYTALSGAGRVPAHLPEPACAVVAKVWQALLASRACHGHRAWQPVRCARPRPGS
jgi:hypothetical protein